MGARGVAVGDRVIGAREADAQVRARGARRRRRERRGRVPSAAVAAPRRAAGDAAHAAHDAALEGEGAAAAEGHEQAAVLDEALELREARPADAAGDVVRLGRACRGSGSAAVFLKGIGPHGFGQPVDLLGQLQVDVAVEQHVHAARAAGPRGCPRRARRCRERGAGRASSGSSRSSRCRPTAPRPRGAERGASRLATSGARPARSRSRGRARPRRPRTASAEPVLRRRGSTSRPDSRRRADAEGLLGDLGTRNAREPVARLEQRLLPGVLQQEHRPRAGDRARRARRFASSGDRARGLHRGIGDGTGPRGGSAREAPTRCRRRARRRPSGTAAAVAGRRRSCDRAGRAAPRRCRRGSRLP